MYSIVPLAGPDFWIDKLGIAKPLLEVEGKPLLERALYSREWVVSGALSSKRFIFVLRETPHTADFQKYLSKTFPGSQSLVLSNLTEGALLSALAGTSLIKHPQEPICVDLVDILYKSEGLGDVNTIFETNPRCGGILPYFRSRYEKYSYLAIKEGQVVQTAEKRVISDNASAGTYWVRNLPTLLEAVSGSLKRRKSYEVNGSLFLCPAYNEIVKMGWNVVPFKVHLDKCISRYVKELETS